MSLKRLPSGTLTKKSSGRPHLFWQYFVTLCDQIYPECSGCLEFVLNAITGIKCQCSLSARITALFHMFLMCFPRHLMTAATWLWQENSAIQGEGVCPGHRDMCIGCLLVPIAVLSLASSFLCSSLLYHCVFWSDVISQWTFCKFLPKWKVSHNSFILNTLCAFSNLPSLLYSPVFYPDSFRISSFL